MGKLTRIINCQPVIKFTCCYVKYRIHIYMFHYIIWQTTQNQINCIMVTLKSVSKRKNTIQFTSKWISSRVYIFINGCTCDCAKIIFFFNEKCIYKSSTKYCFTLIIELNESKKWILQTIKYCNIMFLTYSYFRFDSRDMEIT